MDDATLLRQFSANRLGGEPVPADLAILLRHREELAAKFDFHLNAEQGWAPWLDTTYLRPEELADPTMIAINRAIAEVCSMTAFVASHDHAQYVGYWRGPANRPVAGSSLVWFDNEGSFHPLRASTFAEALLAIDAEKWGEDEREGQDFEEARDWLRSIGVALRPETPADLPPLPEGETADRICLELIARYRPQDPA